METHITRRLRPKTIHIVEAKPEFINSLLYNI